MFLARRTSADAQVNELISAPLNPRARVRKKSAFQRWNTRRIAKITEDREVHSAFNNAKFGNAFSPPRFESIARSHCVRRLKPLSFSKQFSITALLRSVVRARAASMRTMPSAPAIRAVSTLVIPGIVLPRFPSALRFNAVKVLARARGKSQVEWHENQARRQTRR